MLNYLYPSKEISSQGLNATLVFDGQMDVDIGGCSLPPFGEEDVVQTIGWLRDNGLGGFLPVSVNA